MCAACALRCVAWVDKGPDSSRGPHGRTLHWLQAKAVPTIEAHAVMAYAVMAYVVMAYIVMAAGEGGADHGGVWYIVMALYSDGLYSYGCRRRQRRS